MSDLIDRQEALEALDGEITVTGRVNAEAVRGYVNLVCDRIKRLPSAQPERKKGQWMKEDRGHVEYCAVCDQCGFDWIWSDREYFKFCPNCGADMRGEKDGH